MDNESYMKIMDAIRKSLDGIGYMFNWHCPIDITTRSGPGTRISFECFECEDAKEPTPTSRIYYRKYFDANHDDYRVEELVFENDKDALKAFKSLIQNNRDKVRWNPTELYRYDEDIKIALYSCDMHKPDYQKIDEINAKLRNMK